MRLLRLKELCRWMNVTPIELFLLLTATLIFSFLTALKLDEVIELSWWTLFSLYFVADGMLCYFSVIVFIRQFFRGRYKIAAVRALWSFAQLLSIFALKQLLCSKLDSHKQLTFSEVFTPLYGLLMVLMVRACQIRWWSYDTPPREFVRWLLLSAAAMKLSYGDSKALSAPMAESGSALAKPLQKYQPWSHRQRNVALQPGELYRLKLYLFRVCSVMDRETGLLSQ